MAGKRFEGKVVLVTGGSSGIGRAAALAFASEGAAVMIVCRSERTGRSVVDETRAHGARAELFCADLSVATLAEEMVQQTVSRFGRLDCAFNNAGTLEAGTFKALEEFEEEEYERHLALNLKSMWLCMKYEIRQMIQQGDGGSIVNTSSVNALGGVPQNALYAAAKAGVIALTKSAALELASRNIRVNALVPGGFRTPMLEGVFSRMSPEDPAAAEAAFAGYVPMGRVGDTREAADAVLWLSSEEASYVTGHSLVIDGAMTAAFR